MHPYYKYVVLFDRDMDFMISGVLEDSVINAEGFVRRLEGDIKLYKKKNKLDIAEHLEINLRVANKVLSEAKDKLNQWHSKQVAKITDDQKDALFGNQTVS